MRRKITAFPKLEEHMLNENGDNRSSPSIFLSDRRSHAMLHQRPRSTHRSAVGGWACRMRSPRPASIGDLWQQTATGSGKW